MVRAEGHFQRNRLSASFHALLRLDFRSLPLKEGGNSGPSEVAVEANRAVLEQRDVHKAVGDVGVHGVLGVGRGFGRDLGAVGREVHRHDRLDGVGRAGVRSSLDAVVEIGDGVDGRVVGAALVGGHRRAGLPAVGSGVWTRVQASGTAIA